MQPSFRQLFSCLHLWLLTLYPAIKHGCCPDRLRFEPYWLPGRSSPSLPAAGLNRQPCSQHGHFQPKFLRGAAQSCVSPLGLERAAAPPRARFPGARTGHHACLSALPFLPAQPLAFEAALPTVHGAPSPVQPLAVSQCSSHWASQQCLMWRTVPEPRSLGLHDPHLPNSSLLSLCLLSELL